MQVIHYALAISSLDEIKNFYEQVLNFKYLYDFTIAKELASKIFGVARSSQVVVVERDNIRLELFIDDTAVVGTYNHLCITVDCFTTLCQQAQKSDYQVMMIERAGRLPMAFISDKNGNKFEIKCNKEML